MHNKLDPKSPNATENRIAHFGGSFNPVHDGHIALARRLVDDFGFERVVFCPNSRHYPKSGLAPEEDRLAMLEAAVADDPRLVVSAYELGRDDWTRTVETLRHLQKTLTTELGEVHLFSIRGDDWLHKMKKWKALDELGQLCTFLLVSRTGLELPELAESDDRVGKVMEHCVVMDAAGIPAISSTAIRHAILARAEGGLPVPAGVEEIIKNRGLYGAVPPGEDWLTVCRPGYSGRQGRKRDAQRNEVYGPGNWRTAFRWGERTILYSEALILYEDAYFQHFMSDPGELEWLLDTACEVYDNSDSNVLSGTDYTVQEATSTHLQDIAIRRCLVRKGLEFRGDHLVEIRGKSSEGYRLNPGQIPFHRPDLIVQPEPKSWWNPGSVEAFWQANKVLQVKEKSFGPDLTLHVHLLISGTDDSSLVQTEEARPVSLPTFVWKGGTDFRLALSNHLADLGLAGVETEPTFSNPIVREGTVHVLLAGTGSSTSLPDAYQFLPAKRVVSSRLPKLQKELLKRHRA